MTAEAMYTSDEYLKENPTWHTEDSPWKAKQILKIIGKNELQPKSICEIGCGAGEILRQMFLQMSNDISFAGYEISSNAFELCKQREADRLSYKLANLLEDTSAFFDIVMAIDVFEHVEDCFGFLRSLKGKGIYKIFHIPLEMNIHGVLRPSRMLFARKKVGHIHYFCKDTALAILKDVGYEIIDYFYTAGSVELSGMSPVNILRRIGFRIAPDLTVRTFGGYSLMVLTK